MLGFATNKVSSAMRSADSQSLERCPTFTKAMRCCEAAHDPQQFSGVEVSFLGYFINMHSFRTSSYDISDS